MKKRRYLNPEITVITLSAKENMMLFSEEDIDVTDLFDNDNVNIDISGLLN